jgi:hypothetical protein
MAVNAFREIRRYFPHDTALAEALSWDTATVAAWRADDVVRPQMAKVVQVLLLHELCEEARAYFDDDNDVARWINAPLPNLELPKRRGATPAMWLNAYRKAGLDQLTRGLVEWMPKIPEYDLEPVAVAETRETDNSAVREFERVLAELS